MDPSERIDQHIAGIKDWRGKTFGDVRKMIVEADPEIIEEWKWMGSPVWSRDGLIAVGNAHKDKVKITFQYGAFLPDPAKLFNAGFEGNSRRAIDLFEGDSIDKRALQNLVRAAISHNQASLKKNKAKTNKAPAGTSKRAKASKSRK